jgi:hypothetical protein
MPLLFHNAFAVIIGETLVILSSKKKFAGWDAPLFHSHEQKNYRTDRKIYIERHYYYSTVLTHIT